MSRPPVDRPDEVADAALLARQHERFLAFLRKRLRNAADAEDVLQTAYVKALTSKAKLLDRSSIVAWFFQVLRRAALDHVRHDQAGTRAVSARGDRDARAAAPDHARLHDAACACVEALLPGLPRAQAEIVRRVDLDGATPAEAAAALGLTAGNASVRLHRARKALRARLEAVCGTCTRHHCLDCHCKGDAASAHAPM